MVDHLADPIFVVGAQRSGTTLLASLLAAHPQLSSGPEAKVFEKLTRAQLEAATADDAWPRLAVGALARVRLSGERVIDLFDLSEDTLFSYLEHRSHTAAAMLAALFEADGRLPAGGRWVEKTPNHLEHLDTIMREFPDARIVRVLRDPRDVAASQAKVPWASSSRLTNAWLWREFIQRTRPQVDCHSKAILTVRYEDLLMDPETTMRRVCAHVSVPFEPAMLDPEAGANAVTTSVETWKAKNSSALDPSRAYAWRNSRDDTTTAIGALCSSELTEFGYPEIPEITREIRAFIGRSQALDAAESALVAVGVLGVRICSARPSDSAVVHVPKVSVLLRRGMPLHAARIIVLRMLRLLGRRPTKTLQAGATASS